MIRLRWHSAALHDPANRQAAPDHGVVVGVALAADHCPAQRDGFVIGHRERVKINARPRREKEPADPGPCMPRYASRDSF